MPKSRSPSAGPTLAPAAAAALGDWNLLRAFLAVYETGTLTGAARWLAEQPELEIELSVSNRAENLLRRDADIAVRFFRPQQDAMIAQRVGTTELGLYAHESFIARHGEPQGWTLPEGAFATGFDRET